MAGMDDSQMNLSEPSGATHHGGPDSSRHTDSAQQDQARGSQPGPRRGFTGAGPYFLDTRKSRLTLLSQAIESAVIPRMVEAHRRQSGPRTAAASDSTGSEDHARAISAHTTRQNWHPEAIELREFVTLLIDRDDDLAPQRTEELLASGVPIDSLYTEIFAPAARLLGTMWDADETDFTAVTRGVIRLHRLLHLLDERFTGSVPLKLPAKRILLMTAIGEQHGFGLAIVAQYFRRARWDVSLEQITSNSEVAALVRGSWFDVVGFSSSREQSLPQLATTVRATRKASRNQHLRIMVGGSVFVAQPGRYRETGADATAADASQAVIEAEALISLLARTG